MVCPCGGTEVDKDPARGDIVCTSCGKVLEDTIIVSEVQFAENAGGGASVIGQFVSSEGGTAPSTTLGNGFHPGMGKESRTVTLQKGKRKISELAASLKLNQHCVDMAYNFYKMAVMRRVTRGRKSAHVIAACVYLVCRTEGTPHMLLDFSDVLQINVYTLGKTYLALARLLCINVPAIDPSLLIPRFAHKLEFGDKEHEVSMTAIRLVARMKRDWMAVGRRPSGLCGAALLVASRIHNFCRYKRDIIKIVKVCESTLRKRLVEFEETASGSLTVEEFQTIDLEEEADPPCFTQSRKEAKLKQIDDQLSMTEYTNEITDLTHEIDKELESKSLRKAQQLQLEANQMLKGYEVVGEERLEDSNAQNYLQTKIISESIIGSEGNGPSTDDNIPAVCRRPTAASLGLMDCVTPQEQSVREDDNTDGELDVTGLDDSELDKFILSDNERRIKERVWMELNGEFLKAQEEKAKKRAEEEKLKPSKPKKRRRRMGPINASTAGEAMEKMLQEKKISSKINYDVLRNLSADSPAADLLSLRPDNACTVSTTAAVSPAAAEPPVSTAADPLSHYLAEVVDETHLSASNRSSSSSRKRSKPSVSSSSRNSSTDNTSSAQSLPIHQSTTESPTKSSSSTTPGSSSRPTSTSTATVPGTVVESGPVVESGHVLNHPEAALDEEEDERYDDEDEPISAAQLLNYNTAGDYGADDDDYYD